MHLLFSSPCYFLLFDVLPSIQSLQPSNFKVDGVVSRRRVDHLVGIEAGNEENDSINVEDVLGAILLLFLCGRQKILSTLAMQTTFENTLPTISRLRSLPRRFLLYMRITCVRILTLGLNYLAESALFHYLICANSIRNIHMDYESSYGCGYVPPKLSNL